MDRYLFQLTFLKEELFERTLYYLFKDETGRIRMLEAEGYERFNMQPMEKVWARSEKKDCAGDKITELLHPHFLEGKVYPFSIVKTEHCKLNGEKIVLLLVKAETGEHFRLRANENRVYIEGEPVKCRLVSQNHGHLNFHIEK